jgi:glycosyltransferase involved in cell wall biosynthesis
VVIVTDNPFFTIITASFSNASTIKQTIESIKNQTFHSFEHIVIDGGSVDGTIDILEDYKSTYNLYFISEPDEGISNALNKGLGLAKGNYILVLHADDCLLSPEVLGYVYKLIKNQKYDIYSFPVLKEYPDRRIFIYRPIRIMWWHHFKTIFPHQGSFVHQRTYRLLGGYREHLSITMDYDFFYRALQSRCSVKFEKQPIARMGGGGISSSAGFLAERLREEMEVQKINEKNRVWRLAQYFFWILYFPYKTQVAACFKKLSPSRIKKV